MKRPTIPPKPPAPSIHPILRPAAQGARRLWRDVRPLSEAELFADIKEGLGLPEGWLDSMQPREHGTDGN